MNTVENQNVPTIAQEMMQYLACPCRYFPPASKDDEIFTAYQTAITKGKQEGFTPILLAADDETLWDCLLLNTDPNFEIEGGGSYNPLEGTAYRQKFLALSLPDGKDLLAKMIKERMEELEEYGFNWDAELAKESKEGYALDRLIGYWDFEDKKTIPLILAEIPVQNPWEIFAYLPFGGWNDCPDTPSLMSITKYWYQQHGAVPVFITHDVLVFSLSSTVAKENSLQLALEHFVFCPDTIEQGGEDASFPTLADGLTKSTYWYFWWD